AMTEGTVVEWSVAEGDPVTPGQEILEIETTKLANVFEAPTGGTLRRRVAGDGETLPVGALLAVIADDDVEDDEIDAFVSGFVVEVDEDAEAAAEPEPQRVDAGGRSIRYLEMGEGEDTSVVLIHGFGADLGAWMFVQPGLAETTRTYALDLPGHGGSAKDVGGATVSDFAETVAAFMAACGIGSAHLVGHSLGGGVAIEMALRDPASVASLSLVAPSGLGPDINGAFIQGFIEAGRRKELKPVLEELVADPSLISRDMINDVLKFKRLDGVIPALTAIAEAAFGGGRQQTVLADRLGEIACPVQVIWGADDRILPASHADAFSGAVHILPDTGHMPHMEQAAEVTRLISALIGQDG
ncbi:MAG: acetoin dehydrogenase dihydrolipoyllysine-residue acetyltransferase subunit, partial [Hyphomicrobiales bacterium]